MKRILIFSVLFIVVISVFSENLIVTPSKIKGNKTIEDRLNLELKKDIEELRKVIGSCTKDSVIVWSEVEKIQECIEKFEKKKKDFNQKLKPYNRCITTSLPEGSRKIATASRYKLEDPSIRNWEICVLEQSLRIFCGRHYLRYRKEKKIE